MDIRLRERGFILLFKSLSLSMIIVFMFFLLSGSKKKRLIKAMGIVFEMKKGTIESYLRGL